MADNSITKPIRVHMKRNFTMNAFVPLLYKESSPEETLQLQGALRADPAVQLEYRQLQSAKRLLPKVQFTPSRKCLQKVLSYSERTAVEPQW